MLHDPWLLFSAAAEYIGVKERTLRSYSDKKKILSYGGGRGKKNGLIRFKQSDLDAYLESIKNEVKPPCLVGVKVNKVAKKSSGTIERLRPKERDRSAG